MKDYIKIARIDHWIKQLFILPGTAAAYLLVVSDLRQLTVVRLLIGLLATSLIASANYVINEWLDAPYDKFHPTKKYRPVVSSNMKGSIVYAEYAVLAIVGLLLALVINRPFLYMEIWLLVMGILYNVKPFRTKDVIYLDVLSESVNNMIRLLMGWFLVTDAFVPPSSILLGYWMGGAFLMAMKRFSEYRMIDNPETAGLYRRSFKFYDEKKLISSAFYYAMISTFCIGVFLVKYRIEYLVAIPFIFVMFAYYMALSFKKDSAAQKPEKLYREKALLVIVAVVVLLLLILTLVDIPALEVFGTQDLIRIR